MMYLRLVLPVHAFSPPVLWWPWLRWFSSVIWSVACGGGWAPLSPHVPGSMILSWYTIHCVMHPFNNNTLHHCIGPLRRWPQQDMVILPRKTMPSMCWIFVSWSWGPRCLVMLLRMYLPSCRYIHQLVRSYPLFILVYSSFLDTHLSSSLPPSSFPFV